MLRANTVQHPASISTFLYSKQQGETQVGGQVEERGQLPWKRWWVGNRANGLDLRRAKLRPWVSQWKLLLLQGKSSGLHLQLPRLMGKALPWELQQTSRLQAGMSPQCKARLSGRITVPGNGLTNGDMQTDGCKKLCFKTARSRQQCCLLCCCVHLCARTDGKRIPEIA